MRPRVLAACDAVVAIPLAGRIDSLNVAPTQDAGTSRMTIVTTGSVNVNSVGTYTLHYNVSDPSDNAATEVTRTVNVVDTTAQGVQVYRALADGKKTPDFIGRFGVQGVGDGAFQYPNGVAVDDRGHIYVTDRLNGRIQVWSK